VFHRNTVEDQAKVLKKALAYAELVITGNSRYKMPEQPKGKQRVSYVEEKQKGSAEYLQISKMLKC
jgi:hypothetical protein